MELLTEPVTVEVDGDERRRNGEIVDQREQFDEKR